MPSSAANVTAGQAPAPAFVSTPVSRHDSGIDRGADGKLGRVITHPEEGRIEDQAPDLHLNE